MLFTKPFQTTNMAIFQNQYSLLLAFMLFLSLTFGRELLQCNPNPNPSSLEVRLRSGLTSNGGGFTDCWNAMMELKSCTNEIVLFFLNGESYLSIPCCRAIRLITHMCWPSILPTIGFTAEEGDVLRGYCDAEVAASPPPSPAPSSTAASMAMVVNDELMV